MQAKLSIVPIDQLSLFIGKKVKTIKTGHAGLSKCDAQKAAYRNRLFSNHDKTPAWSCLLAAHW